MNSSRHRCYVAGRPVETGRWLPVEDKFRGTVRAEVALAGPKELEAAAVAAVNAAPAMAAWPRYQRRDALLFCADAFEKRAKELADLLVWEVGKPLGAAETEVSRLIETFRFAGYETTQAPDDAVLPLDASARGAGHAGFVKRVPIGPSVFIAPFNFPLNLAAHKVAPALAAGCPFVLKPATKTPLSALLLGEVLAQAALPEGAFSIVPCDRQTADTLVRDERFRLLSFTGSPAVGWEMKKNAGTKKVILELGGNAACFVADDGDVKAALALLVPAIFGQAGQSCISVQRVFADRAVYAALRDGLVAATRALKAGDPAERTTIVGPLIGEKEAAKLEEWVKESVRGGGTLLCGGTRQGALFAPTLVENAPHDCSLVADEAFGPVAVLEAVDGFEAGLDRINDTRFGLQAGVFTASLDRALRAWERLAVGAVLINQVPTWRVDPMPYGGVKDSGLGREGLRASIEEMTEPRLLVVKR